MNITFIIVVAISFLVYIGVGNYAGRKVKNVEDYYVVGRNAPTVLIVGTLVASFFSTNAFMGDGSFSYDGYPVLLLILAAINSCGYIFGALYFGRYLRRSKVLTVTEFFGQRFNSKRIQKMAGFTTIIALFAYLVAVNQGAAIIITELLNCPFALSLLIVGIAYASFTFYSGSRGVIITDTIMFFIFAFAMIASTPYIFGAGGGWTATISKLVGFTAKPGIMDWQGISGANGGYWATSGEALFWAISLGIVWVVVVAVSPWQSSRYLMAKNENVTLRSAMLAALAYVVLYLVLQFGMAALNLTKADIDPSERAFAWACINLLPRWLGAIGFAGLLAAALSSCSTFLSLIGFSVYRDFLIKEKEEKEEKVMLKKSRVIMLFVTVVALIITYFQPPAVMQITYFAATVFACSWGPVAFASIWSKRITEAGAFYSMLAGLLGVLIPEMLELAGVSFTVYFSSATIGFICSIVSLIVVSAFTKVTEPEKAYREKLFIVPEGEYTPALLKRTFNIGKVTIAVGLLTIIALYFIYYLPYSNAI